MIAKAIFIVGIGLYYTCWLWIILTACSFLFKIPFISKLLWLWVSLSVISGIIFIVYQIFKDTKFIGG